MNREIFVFDHDGTLTDPVRTHHVYTDIFETEFSNRAGIPRGVIHDHMNEARAEIILHPQIYAWERDGYKIAPATVDTYVLNTVAAEMVIAAMQADNKTEGLPTDVEGIKTFIQGLYFASYPKVEPYYRPETARMIRELQPLGQLVIVSNSDPKHIHDKIVPFLTANNIPDNAVEVIGDARKFTITPDWDRVIESTDFPRLERPVFLRRGFYGGVLLNLGQAPNRIIGDSGEMDLAMPSALGFRTLLLQTPFSAPWELKVFEHVNSLDAVTNRIIGDLGK